MAPKITLEQWATFLAVVEEGSFARAAEVLNKSQSSVSYTISRLEEQLPTPALKLDGRRAVLTEAGKVLFRYAQNLLTQASDIEKIAGCLATGWETELTLAIDALTPRKPLFCALQLFSQQSPQTRIRILETTLSGTDEAILLRQAEIVLTPDVLPGFMGIPLCTVQMRYVVAPSHPLAQLNRDIDENDLKVQRQIVVRDSGIKRQQDAGWLGANQRWTVTHFSTSIDMVLSGLGFANLPLELIDEEIAAKKLVVLNFASGAQRNLPLYLIKTAQSQAGPAAQALSDVIVQQFKTKS